MTKLLLGTGNILVQHGDIENEGKVIALAALANPAPVGASQLEWDKQTPQEDYDVIFVFKNLESLRVLQDQVSELAAEWAREINPKI